LYVSNDYGQSWTDISKALPNEPINVVKEDNEDDQIVYVGTDNGLYISFDGGSTFQSFTDIPKVAVHDIVIQKKDNHLLIGTHGRSIYKVNLIPVRKYKEIREKALFVYDIKKVLFSEDWGRKFNSYSEPRTAKSEIIIFSNKEGIATVELRNREGKVFQKQTIELLTGLRYYDVKWSIDETSLKEYEKWIFKDLNYKRFLKKKDDGKYYPQVGEYKVKVSAHGVSQEVDLIIDDKK
jgi:hypothetical protein